MNKLLTSVFAFAVASVTAFSQAQDIKGDAKAGEKINAMCIGCHGIVGYQASFPEVYKVPMISGQNAKFILASLTQYKDGARKHPTMRAIAESLTEQDMANLAAFYSTHGGDAVKVEAKPAKEPGTKAAALLKAGNCASCHGANFSTPIDPSYPKLAGQHKDYLTVALRSYTKEGAPSWGRSHASMSATLKAAQTGVSAREYDQQLREVAAYFASLPTELKVIPESRFR
jgi:cytochrome c553